METRLLRRLGPRNCFFYKPDENRLEVLFYLVARFKSAEGYYPLAVVAQTPPTDDHWLFIDPEFIRLKAAYIYFFLTDPVHRTAIEAELDLAAELYASGTASVLGDRRPPPGAMTRDDRNALLRDPSHALFPCLTHGLLRAVQRGCCRLPWCTEESKRYWSPIPLNTTFSHRDRRYAVAVLDITDLDRIGCGLFIRRRGAKRKLHLMTFGAHRKYTFGRAKLRFAPNKRDRVFLKTPVSLEDITKMHWGQDGPKEVKLWPKRFKYYRLIKLAMSSLGRSVQPVLSLNPRAPRDASGLLSLVDDLFQELTDGTAPTEVLTRALARLLVLILGNEVRLRLGRLRSLSCDTLAMALESPTLQRTRTLSFATEVLARGDVAALVEVLRDMPKLKTVYVVERQREGGGGSGGGPTEESRRATAELQVKLVQAALATGGKRLRSKIYCSASYESALRGLPILEGNVE
ncbi:hypothetical protein PWT90_01419 [Aphanocladium album]|nr:hypothetical protein PWT90_01419 [Aphanocladium album]